MSEKASIMIYNRVTGRLEPEVVLGEGFVRFLYETASGRFLASAIFKRRLFSKMFGLFQDTRVSARKIRKVAADLSIDLSEAEQVPEDFKSFNDFFTRSLKREARPIDPDPSVVVSPCDARLLAFPGVDQGAPFSVKGSEFCLDALLGDAQLASEYAGGTLLIYRLCPADYHRFHFPESGVPGPVKTMNGPLHSVNPIALAGGMRILDSNLRQQTLIEAGNKAGRICMVEIGAMCVGSIVQTFKPGVPIERGDEKGMFRFGGSTVVVLYEPGRVRMDGDILDHSKKSIETFVRLGTSVGSYS